MATSIIINGITTVLLSELSKTSISITISKVLSILNWFSTTSKNHDSSSVDTEKNNQHYSQKINKHLKKLYIDCKIETVNGIINERNNSFFESCAVQKACERLHATIVQIQTESECLRNHLIEYENQSFWDRTFWSRKKLNYEKHLKQIDEYMMDFEIHYALLKDSIQNTNHTQAIHKTAPIISDNIKI